jgi:WD40 repeat protein
VATFEENDDTISGMVLTDDHTKLLASSNDGFLAVFDIRKAEDDFSNGQAIVKSHRNHNFKPDLFALSDCQEEELTGVCLVKNGKKVVTSSSEGVVSLWSWDWFGDCNDRMTGHSSSISSMVKYDEDTILTGCDDGYVRALSVLPNRVISVINDDMYEHEEPMPVSSIAHNGSFCAVVSNDTMVQIYSLSSLKDRYIEEYDSEDEENIQRQESNMQKRKKILNSDDDDQMDIDDGKLRKILIIGHR